MDVKNRGALRFALKRLATQHGILLTEAEVELEVQSIRPGTGAKLDVWEFEQWWKRLLGKSGRLGEWAGAPVPGRTLGDCTACEEIRVHALSAAYFSKVEKVRLHLHVASMSLREKISWLAGDLGVELAPADAERELLHIRAGTEARKPICGAALDAWEYEAWWKGLLLCTLTGKQDDGREAKPPRPPNPPSHTASLGSSPVALSLSQRPHPSPAMRTSPRAAGALQSTLSPTLAPYQSFNRTSTAGSLAPTS